MKRNALVSRVYLGLGTRSWFLALTRIPTVALDKLLLRRLPRLPTPGLPGRLWQQRQLLVGSLHQQRRPCLQGWGQQAGRWLLQQQ